MATVELASLSKYTCFRNLLNVILDTFRMKIQKFSRSISSNNVNNIFANSRESRIDYSTVEKVLKICASGSSEAEMTFKVA